MSNKAYALLKSVIALIIFAGLACYFDKWWLVLFSLLYMVTIENKKDLTNK